MLFPIRKEK